MTLGDIAVKARALTNTDSTAYPDANLLIDINIYYQKVVTMILESMDETDFDDARQTNYPIQTTPLIANQRDYTIPVGEKVLKIKRVDISWNGGTNWFRAQPFDSGAYPYGIGFDQANSTDVELDQNFIRERPRYDVAYNSIFVFPMPVATDVANGAIMRTEWERQIKPFTSADYTSVLTDSTVVPGFDDPFHPMLSLGAALEYGNAHVYPQTGIWTQELTDYEGRLRQAYGRKLLDRELRMDAAYNDATYR